MATDWEGRAWGLRVDLDPHSKDEVEAYALALLREFVEEAAGIALAHDTTEPHTHNSPCHEVIWSDILNLLPPKKEGA